MLVSTFTDGFSFSKSGSLQHSSKVANVVPGDFTHSGKLDLLVMSYGQTSGQLDMVVYPGLTGDGFGEFLFKSASAKY